MAATDPADATAIVWSPCGYCWGQGRVHDAEVIQVAGDAREALQPVLCPACIGVGQTAHMGGPAPRRPPARRPAPSPLKPRPAGL